MREYSAGPPALVVDLEAEEDGTSAAPPRKQAKKQGRLDAYFRPSQRGTVNSPKDSGRSASVI